MTRETEAMTELLSCPFCGSSDIDPEGTPCWHDETKDEIVHIPACRNCGCTGVDDWNKRAAPPAKDYAELVKELDAWANEQQGYISSGIVVSYPRVPALAAAAIRELEGRSTSAMQGGEMTHESIWYERIVKAVEDRLNERDKELTNRSCKLYIGDLGSGDYNHPIRQIIREIQADALANHPRQQWQDISTAPKDGTDVLLWWPEWNPDAPVVGYCRDGRWMEGFNHTAAAEYFGSPTHWQPLPQPPSSNAQIEKVPG